MNTQIIENLILDLSEFLGVSETETVERMERSTGLDAKRWSGVNPDIIDEVLNYYKSGSDYLASLTWWHTNFEYRSQWTTQIATFFDSLNLKTCVDFGCGIGTDGLTLLMNDAERVSFIEVGDDLREYLSWKLDKYELSGKAQLLTKVPKEKTDLGILVDVVGHLKNPQKYLIEIARYCKYLFYTEDFDIGVAAYPMHFKKPINWDRLMQYLFIPLSNSFYESRIFNPSICVLPNPPPPGGGVSEAIKHNKKAIMKMEYRVSEDPSTSLIVHTHAVGLHPRSEVYTNHGYYGPQDDPNVGKYVNPIVDINVVSAREVLCVSEAAPQLLKETKPQLQPQVLPNCVDLEELYSVIPLGQDMPYVLWGKANNLDPVVNFSLAAKVAVSMPSMRFIFVSGTGLPMNATVVGTQDRTSIIKWIGGAVALLLTGKENNSLMVLEALALGTPIVATNNCGMLDFIKHKETGYIGNSVDEIIVGIQYCKDHRDELSENCLQIGRGLGIENYAESLKKVYDSVVSDNLKELREPLVSFVIPAYNMQDYLRETIDSVLAQTNQDFEVIIINDGSTDDTWKIALEYASTKPDVSAYRTKNHGVYHARNYGLSKSRGKYICCLDGDDKVDPKFIDTLSPILESDRSVGIAYSDFVIFGSQSGRVKVRPMTLDQLRLGNGIPCCNLFRRTAWELVGGYKKIDPSWEDYEFWLSIVEAGFRAIPVNEPLYYYRKKGEQGRDWNSQGHEPMMRGQVRKYHPDLYPPIVSVIIPCYNQEQYLEDSIGSVMNQTFQDFEVIVVDDGNDKAIKLPDYYSSVKVIRHKKNQGLAASRNTGVSAAIGKYILTLDADDKIKPSFLTKSVNVLETDPTISIVYSDVEAFGSFSKIFPMPDYDFDELIKRNQMACASLYRREIFEAVGGYKLDMIHGWEDYDFWIHAGKLGFCGVRIPEPLFMYRRAGNSMIMMAQNHLPELRAKLKEHHPEIYRGERSSMCCGGRSIRSAPAQNRTLQTGPAAFNVGGQKTILISYDGPERIVPVDGSRHYHLKGPGDYLIMELDLKLFREMGLIPREELASVV